MNRLVENVVDKNSEEIKKIEEKLIKYSNCLIIKSENKVIQLLNKINLLQMKKLKNKMLFLNEYENFLLQREKALRAKENEELVQTYLRKRESMDSN